jgi:hypothetical protein
MPGGASPRRPTAEPAGTVHAFLRVRDSPLTEPGPPRLPPSRPPQLPLPLACRPPSLGPPDALPAHDLVEILVRHDLACQSRRIVPQTPATPGRSHPLRPPFPDPGRQGGNRTERTLRIQDATRCQVIIGQLRPCERRRRGRRRRSDHGVGPEDRQPRLRRHALRQASYGTTCYVTSELGKFAQGETKVLEKSRSGSHRSGDHLTAATRRNRKITRGSCASRQLSLPPHAFGRVRSRERQGWPRRSTPGLMVTPSPTWRSTSTSVTRLPLEVTSRLSALPRW